MKFYIAATAILALAAIASAKFCPKYDIKVIVATSQNAKGLRHAVNKFQNLLGGEANGAQPGPFKDGFRVINWDGGAPFDMPFDFFNTVAPLGALFFSKRNKFAISNPLDNNPVDDKFDSINPRAAKRFIAFSEKRLFTPVKGNVVITRFQVPGKKIDATVSGFGAVFVDAKKRHASFLELFDVRGCRIVRVAVPKKAKGLSFVGAIVKRARYYKHGKYGKWVRVRAPVFKAKLKLGNTPISRKSYNYRRADIVVTDDFIYGEPQEFVRKHRRIRQH